MYAEHYRILVLQLLEINEVSFLFRVSIRTARNCSCRRFLLLSNRSWLRTETSFLIRTLCTGNVIILPVS